MATASRNACGVPAAAARRATKIGVLEQQHAEPPDAVRHPGAQPGRPPRRRRPGRRDPQGRAPAPAAANARFASPMPTSARRNGAGGATTSTRSGVILPSRSRSSRSSQSRNCSRSRRSGRPPGRRPAAVGSAPEAPQRQQQVQRCRGGEDGRPEPLAEIRGEQGGHAAPRRPATAASLPAAARSIVQTPRSPSTVTRWPDRMRPVAASRLPRRRGGPNSRATIAPCESRPPRSITRPDTRPKTRCPTRIGLAGHQHVSAAEAGGVADVAEDRRGTGCRAAGGAGAGQRRRERRRLPTTGLPVPAAAAGPEGEILSQGHGYGRRRPHGPQRGVLPPRSAIRSGTW